MLNGHLINDDLCISGPISRHRDRYHSTIHKPCRCRSIVTLIIHLFACLQTSLHHKMKKLGFRHRVDVLFQDVQSATDLFGHTVFGNSVMICCPTSKASAQCRRIRRWKPHTQVMELVSEHVLGGLLKGRARCVCQIHVQILEISRLRVCILSLTASSQDESNVFFNLFLFDVESSDAWTWLARSPDRP